MSNTPSQVAKFALQDILLGIADSLTDAQEELNSLPPYDAYGRPNTMYQLPYLDFQLQVTSEFASETLNNAAGVEVATNQRMFFEPARTTPTQGGGSSQRTEVFSTITGRFVATVPNEGLPQVIISVKQEDPVLNNGWYEIELEAVVANAAQEKLVNSKVEFNFDQDASEALNSSTISTAPQFTASELNTDADGKVVTTFKVEATEMAIGKFFVVTVNSGTVVKTISISRES